MRLKMFSPVELIVFLGTWLSSGFLLRWWSYHRKIKHRYPPSLPSLPLVGSLPFLRGFNNIADFFMRKADELGPIFTFRAGSKLILILNSRDVIQDALVNHSTAFSGRVALYSESVVNPNNKGLVLMKTTKEWKKYHQLSFTILKQLGFGVKSVMESRILEEVEFFRDHIVKQNGNSFNPRELVHHCVTNIIMNIVFGRRQDYGLEINQLGFEIKRFIKNVHAVLDVAPIIRFVPFYRKKLRLMVEIHKIILKILRMETEKSLADGADDCFVRRYVESLGSGYDAEQLNLTLRDLIAAGSDTTANTLLWTMIALANNPTIQDRLRAEIDAVVPRDSLPSMNDQPKLPFVEATILEVLRWRTLLSLALPHTTLGDTNVGDYFIPAKTLVLVNLYAAHMDPKVWKDPETFRPERFLDKDGRVINKDSVISFSLGRRSCTGEVLARAELFLILTGLVQRFIIRPPEGQSSVCVKPVEPIAIIMTSSEFNIRLIARV